MTVTDRSGRTRKCRAGRIVFSSRSKRGRVHSRYRDGLLALGGLLGLAGIAVATVGVDRLFDPTGIGVGIAVAVVVEALFLRYPSRAIGLWERRGVPILGFCAVLLGVGNRHRVLRVTRAFTSRTPLDVECNKINYNPFSLTYILTGLQLFGMRSDEGTRTGIVTGEGAPRLTKDGQRLLAALQEREHTVDPVRWDDSSVNWEQYDCLIIRSCWQYYTDREAFRNWIDTVNQYDVHVVNASDILRWNMHKYYLRDLERADVPVIPTEYVDQGSNVDLGTVLERTGWTDVVVKPAVGTSSHDVWRATTPEEPAAATRFRDQLSETDVLVQQFIPAVTQGELSFVFFRGEFNHAYRSFPATDGFRAHPNFGGSVEPDDPPETLVDQASKVVSTASSVLSLDAKEFVYARVDGVERTGEFELMELELIEPYLGLTMSEGTVDRFVEAIQTALCRRTTEPRVEGR